MTKRERVGLSMMMLAMIVLTATEGHTDTFAWGVVAGIAVGLGFSGLYLLSSK